MITRTVSALAVLLLLAACGGGGGGGDAASTDPNIVGSDQPSLTNANSILLSDMLLYDPGYGNVRASNIHCYLSSNFCQATIFGQTYSFYLEEDGSDTADPGDTSTLYTSLGRWNHTRFGVVHLSDADGVSAKMAFAAGVRYPNSLPLSGSASWRGEIVALDENNRLVRGDAYLEIADLRSPRVYAALSPRAYPVMIWDDMPLLNGRFELRRSSVDYIKGELYGPSAREAGGVFERHGLVGAFGAKR